MFTLTMATAGSQEGECGLSSRSKASFHDTLSFLENIWLPNCPHQEQHTLLCNNLVSNKHHVIYHLIYVNGPMIIYHPRYCPTLCLIKYVLNHLQHELVIHLYQIHNMQYPKHVIHVIVCCMENFHIILFTVVFRLCTNQSLDILVYSSIPI